MTMSYATEKTIWKKWRYIDENPAKWAEDEYNT
jgi:hypothetical protein